MKAVYFEGVGRCFYTTEGKRRPKAGEFYLSGAIVQAWRAPNDLPSEYTIVRPTHHAARRTIEERGAAVEFYSHGKPKPGKDAFRIGGEAYEGD